MDAAKVRLSPEEQAMVATPDWILTKNRVIQKIDLLLSTVQTTQKLLLPTFSLLDIKLIDSSPKISKGENYRGLPWLVLDYPRHFYRQDVFAVRTMFWWGHFFSVTLHVAGKYFVDYRSQLLGASSYLSSEGFSACVNENQWEHHFEEGNYQPLALIPPVNLEEHADRTGFFKVAKQVPLNDWNSMKEELIAAYSALLKPFAD